MEEEEVPQRLGRLTRLIGEANSWAGLGDITTDNKINRRAARDVERILTDRYGSETSA